MECVLLKPLGIVPASLAVHDDDLDQLRALFDLPLKDSHLCAIAVIFGTSIPLIFGQEGHDVAERA